MDKRLLLFRHGKSDWAADFDSDHERPLAKRGRQGRQNDGAASNGVWPNSRRRHYFICGQSAVYSGSCLERRAMELLNKGDEFPI